MFRAILSLLMVAAICVSDVDAQRSRSSFGGRSSFSSSKPSFSSGSRSTTSKPSVSKPIFGTSSKSSSKPTVKFDSSASTAKSKATSSSSYESYLNKNKPSSTTYTTKPVTTNKSTTYTNVTRTYTPERYQREQRSYYGDRYDDYRSRPLIDVGGGFSTLFWYSMLDWELDRRAAWLYHNQNNISSDLYKEQLENKELRAEIEKLKEKDVKVDPNYVDPKLVGKEGVMYEPVVEEAKTSDGLSGVVKFFLWAVGFVVVIGIILAIWNSSSDVKYL